MCGECPPATCRAAATAGVDVRYGVDALRLSEGLPKLQMNTARHIVWNFPLAVTAEAADEAASRGGSGRAAAAAAKLMGDDGEANRQLIGKFFAEVARQMASWNPEMKVSRDALVARITKKPW